MAEEYCIWIVSPSGIIWSHVFDEVALGLQSAFHKLGFVVPIVTYSKDIVGRPIILGANLVPEHGFQIPDNAIIFNLEQVHKNSRWFQAWHGYSALLNKYQVWDFSYQNIERLKEFGIKNVIYCGIGYVDELSRIPTVEKDIDALLIGQIHPRRKKVLDGLRDAGKNVHQLLEVFGAERDQWIARSKLHLNIHREHAHLFEIVRVSYLLANRGFVVSEIGTDRQLESQFHDALVFTPYENMVERCLYYLSHDDERLQIAERGFTIFRGIKQVDILAKALEEQRKLDAAKKQEIIEIYEPVKTQPDVDYTLWVVKSPKDTGGHWHCFDEVVTAFEEGLKALGYKVAVVDKPADAAGTVIAIGGRLLHEIREPLPENMIIFNFEQVHEQSRFVNRDNPYLAFLKRYPVWDYSRNNISALKSLYGITDVTYCGIGYMPSLTRIHATGVQDIDVLFIGTRHPRRQYIMDELNKRGLRTHFIFHQYGEARDDFIARSKIVLNMHLEVSNVFEVVRVSYLLANGKCVISETGKDTALEMPFSQAVVFAPYDQLVETCVAYIQDNNIRHAQEQKALKEFKRMGQAELLKSAIDGYAATRHQSGTMQQAVPALLAPILIKPKIFVNIASYRDEECEWTVRDLFKKAAFPERIRVGICWQYSTPQEKREAEKLSIYGDQVRVVYADSAETLGVGWARNKAQTLQRDEDYTLQIDSHMRFEPGWDETLIERLKSLPNNKSVLTGWLPSYSPPDIIPALNGQLARLVVKRLGNDDDAQLVHLNMRMVPVDEMYGKNIPACSWVGNFLFCRSAVLQAISFDPYVHFWGEELNFSVRLWTHGYDIYQLDRVVLYHYWGRVKAKDAEVYRNYRTERNQLSLKRNLHLIGLKPSNDPEVIKDMDRYPLGSERTLQEYWQFTGIDLENRLLSQRAKDGDWPLPVNKKSRIEIFVNIVAFRTPEYKATLEDLFAKANTPGKIRVGLCLMCDLQDTECLPGDWRLPGDIIIDRYPSANTRGIGWGHAQAQKLWQGEPYILQISAFTRFEQGWDEQLIEALRLCENEQAVLTAWLPDYNAQGKEPLDGELPVAVVARIGDFDDTQMVHLTRRMLTQEAFEGKPQPTSVWVNNFMFTRSQTLQDVPFDPYFYYWGEEINYSLRLWTSGYDLYHLHKPVLYHQWNRPAGKADHDFRDHNARGNWLALRRNWRVFNLRPALEPDSIEQVDNYLLGKTRPMSRYMEFSGIDLINNRLAKKAHEGPLALAREPLAAVPQFVAEPAKMQRIYVNIASYRDPELQATIDSLFAKAAHPERVFAGVCLQVDEAQDTNCLVSPHPHVRVKQVHYADSKGANWARSEAMQLWQGEEYVLGIDSHMRFEQGWDKKLLDMLANAPRKKAVITGWVPGYKPPNKFAKNEGKVARLHINNMGQPYEAPFFNVYRHLEPAGQLTPSASVVANFIFAPGRAFEEVPIDPYINFWGDELNLSVRLWTHGWDFFQYDEVVAYHYWDPENIKGRDVYRNRENPKHIPSRERNAHLFGLRQAEAEFTREIDKYPLGTARKLEDYWKFAGVDLVNRTFEKKAKDGKWTLPEESAPKWVTPVAALPVATAPVASKHNGRPRILVCIPSFRDTETQWTVKNLFDKAKYPERVFVAVCWQFDPDEDKKCFEIPYARPGQVRVKSFHYSKAVGLGWARQQAFSLWQGEEYALQIDSHMRFEQGWDEDMIQTLERCPTEKAVLSTYVPRYTPPDKRDSFPGQILRTRIHMLGKPDEPQMLHQTRTPVPLADKERAGLYLAPFNIGNFTFCRAEVFELFPIDPYIQFWGEEITFSARLWTHGYDIYQPDKVMLYHYWRRDELVWQQGYRRINTPRSRAVMARIKHMLNLEKTSDPEALKEIELYGRMGNERSLNDLWAFAGVDWNARTIAKDSEEGRWNMAARKKAVEKAAKAEKNTKPVKAAKNTLPRIFVQIASYRDPECQWTVKDLFDKAAHPERINVGICWQTVKGEDDICFQQPYPYPKQVRVHEVDARQSNGVCWARNLTQQLWEGEEFTLQIDSHMRFEPGWDDMLLGMWQQCDDDKAVLTCYPPGYTPPNEQQRDWIFGMSAKEFDAEGIFLMHGAPGFQVGVDEPEQPIPGAFASANMLFGPSSIIKDVPYDPHLYFFGEEITLAVRLWTNGYNLFHPNRLMIFHDWDRGKRPTHFSDHHDWGFANARSFARVRHMLGTEISNDPQITQELETYGLGKARSLQEYQDYSGVNFANRTISEKAKAGVYEASSQSAPRKAAKAEKQNGARVATGPLIKQGKGDQPSIFINIASYRDPECQWTVKDLFEKAAHPERINVGICWQFDEVEDQHCFEVSTRPDQVRIFPVDWREAEGVCWARWQTQQLWDGEDYNLMLDSHMRFLPGWDELMIKELAACESNKPVISCSPAGYTPPDQLGKLYPTIRRARPFMPSGNLRCQGESLDRSPEKPLPGAFIVANYVFSKSNIISEVPYDPYLYFDQEEITYAARLYTHGWDVFSARNQFLYHYYNDKPTGSVRPLHWKDMQKEHGPRIKFLHERGLKRFNHLTGYALSTDPEITRELGVYGFGRERTLQQYEEFSGVDFKRKVATEKALRCLFIPDLYKYRDRPIYVPELDDKRQQAAAASLAEKQRAASGQQVQSTAAAVTVPAAPMNLLEPGDFLPLFEAVDVHSKRFNIEFYGGRCGVLCFLPIADKEYIKQFYKAWEVQQKQGLPERYAPLFFLDETSETLKAIKNELWIAYSVLSDPDRKVARSFGLCKPGDGAYPPVGFVFDRNLKIQHRFTGMDAASLANNLAASLRNLEASIAQRNGPQQVIRRMPPVLIVPNAFTPQLCEKLIQSFRTGHTFDGTVGADKTYRPDSKIRTDHVVPNHLVEEIDDKLSRSFFPEVKKVFGVQITHRELYKIGMYSGDKKGFFKHHRDNFDEVLGYRRFAMTLHLSDDYEGGGLRFPEYDDHVYRPELGSAIAFSCGTMHEARPVTRGERFVLVGFFHGEQDEAFRRYQATKKNQNIHAKDFTATLRKYPELKQSRQFYDEWEKENVSYSGAAAVPPTQVVAVAQTAQPSLYVPPKEQLIVPEKPNIMINSLGDHKPKKVFESSQAVIIDDFLPEDVYQKINDFALTTDYEYINTGKISRAWHVHDGFPLRSTLNAFYYADELTKPNADYVYPTRQPVDYFIDHMLAVQPHVEHMSGRRKQDWGHFSVTSWIYPHGTGLALHDDGSGVYTGAYVYFVNPVWRPHWGGLLLLVDEEANNAIHDYRNNGDQMDHYKRNWLHANPVDETIMSHGFAKCVFPKRNRIVFISNTAYHMVTRVNEQCGDNLRMSLAGFFNRKAS